MSRVFVAYKSGNALWSAELVGQQRWLDTATGNLYNLSMGGVLVSDGYSTQVGTDKWRNHNNTVVERVTPVVAPTPGYADGNPKSLQGAKKFSLRYLPLSANIAVNQAFEDGAKKYGAANWREKGVATTVYVDAALRHIMQYFDGGQKLAADSGVHNLGHAMACLAIIIDAEQEGQLIDDRPFAAKDTDALLKRPVK